MSTLQISDMASRSPSTHCRIPGNCLFNSFNFSVNSINGEFYLLKSAEIKKHKKIMLNSLVQHGEVGSVGQSMWITIAVYPAENCCTATTIAIVALNMRLTVEALHCVSYAQSMAWVPNLMFLSRTGSFLLGKQN